MFPGGAIWILTHAKCDEQHHKDKALLPSGLLLFVFFWVRGLLKLNQRNGGALVFSHGNPLGI